MAQGEEFEQSLTDFLDRLEVTSEDTMSRVLQRVLLDGETVQVAARAPGGQDMLVQVSPFDYEQDDLSGVLVNLADVTALRESERRRQALMAFLSHDLRTPLASILAVIDIAKLKPEKLEDPKYIENIEHNARRTLKLADDFLYLSRAESAETTSFGDADLVNVALNAFDAVEAQATAKQIRLTKKLPPTAPLVGDAALLERALTNLLSNAVKYSPEKAQVTLGIELVDGQLHCWVEDTGYGIADEDRPKLFARFKRIKREEHQHEIGSGLGLAFVKTVIERHHGTIELESHIGQGSCFHIYLPHKQLFH
jgi:signal transduction histidine kinase